MMRAIIISALAVCLATAWSPSAAETRRAFLQTVSASILVTTVNSQPSFARGGGPNIVFADEDIMSDKGHGTTAQKVQDDLMYGVSNPLADRICSYNRHFAEPAGFFEKTDWKEIVLSAKEPMTFYDSVTGKALFRAPIGRSAEDFVNESRVHGWPSFRDQEVVWDNVRVLKRSGETVVSGFQIFGPIGT
jgi:hypothetical protein